MPSITAKVASWTTMGGSASSVSASRLTCSSEQGVLRGDNPPLSVSTGSAWGGPDGRGDPTDVRPSDRRARAE